MTIVRNASVAVSNLGVKGHAIGPDGEGQGVWKPGAGGQGWP